jgi:hypothetical protein
MRSLQIAIAETESDRIHNLHVKKVDRYMANIATKAEKELSPLMKLKDVRFSSNLRTLLVVPYLFNIMIYYVLLRS